MDEVEASVPGPRGPRADRLDRLEPRPPEPAPGSSQDADGWFGRPAGEPFRVLVVEDDPPDARLVEEMLHDAWPELEVVHAGCLADAYQHLGPQTGCVLLDLRLPDAAGLEAMLQVRAATPAMPVIVLSGLDDDELAVEAVHRGAQDYLVKGHIDGPLVSRAIRHAVERKRAEAELQQREELGRAVLDAVPANLAVLDPEGTIVAVNQAWALHAAEAGGDVLWAGVGSGYLEVCARAKGPVGPDAPRAAAGIREVLAGAPGFQMEYLAATPEGERWHELRVWPLSSGRGGVVVSHQELAEPDGQRPSQRQAALAARGALRGALQRDQLRTFYQPVVRLDTGAVVGFEALARWLHPDRGLVMPAEFIPTAEASGLIGPVGSRVLRAACEQAARWRARNPYLPQPRLAVNLSPGQLADPGLVEEIGGILVATRLDPAALCLEITESAIIEDVGAAVGVLGALKRLGVLLAVDDFGTGYTSLAHLRRFPVDVLKIDRSFVAGVDTRPQDAAIVTAVLGLARALGLEVVAEGVETRAQLAALRSLGCLLAQGFLFAAPRAGELAFGLAAEHFPVDG